MTDLIIILGASQVHGFMPLYLEQLKAASIDYHIHDGSDKPNINAGGNLGYRVNIFKRLAAQFSNYERIVFSDAFDVLFYGTREDVIARIPTDHLLHAAEKNCYPDQCLGLPIPDRGPHRYANGGLVAGTPEQFMKWCDEIPRQRGYHPEHLDQYFLNVLVSQNSPLCIIDHRTELFFCLHSGYNELEFEKGFPINRMYNTRPCFIHANGGYDPSKMFEDQKRSLTL